MGEDEKEVVTADTIKNKQNATSGASGTGAGANGVGDTTKGAYDYGGNWMTNAEWSAWRKQQGDAAAAAGGGSGGYKPTTLPSANSQNNYIQSLYDANLAKQQDALKAAYDRNVLTLDQQAAQIPGQYNAAAEQAAAQAEINRRNFNEYAAASGLNSGAGGQAELARNNALMTNISNIRAQQANAMKEIENKRAQMSMDYQSAIAQAIADNNVNLAKALYEEAVRVDSSLVSTAQKQADEDYRAWATNKFKKPV